MFVIFIVIFKGYDDGFSTLQVAKADRTNGHDCRRPSVIVFDVMYCG